MQSLDNDNNNDNHESSAATSIQALPAAASANRLAKSRHSVATLDSLSSYKPSEATVAHRRSNPSAVSLFASTLTPPGSRSMSPVGRGSPTRLLAGSIFEHGSSGTLHLDSGNSPGQPYELMVQSFVPYVAVYASSDTEELAADKGFQEGIWQLLRPFGERVLGKITVRDSNGMSKSFEDFAIRFVRFGDWAGHSDQGDPESKNSKSTRSDGAAMTSAEGKKVLSDTEQLVNRHLGFAEDSISNLSFGSIMRQGLDMEGTSPYYSLYLRRLLGGNRFSPYETFVHPVACIIAISSRNKSPIEELRKLYADTSQGDKKMPVYVNGDYLRYYVLVHDEERDDVSRSMALFEQMKRHLGLHCHLLRLRSTRSVETDDDSIPLPRSEWMSAAEELAAIEKSDEQEEFEDPTTYIFESDATAIRSFVREMVSQSIIPTMERHISVWNDQVASRRRGITGRFISLSRKWAGFGGGNSSKSSSASSSGGGTSGYSSAGFYNAEAPEAIMRKLADYAFMLRDWELAYSTYDLLRSDFNDAKAWKYHAGAHEMAAISQLMNPQSMSSKTRVETIDRMLDTAFYSYNTRCNESYGAVRTLLLGLELLRLRGGSSVDDAVRWGVRLLEAKLLGPIGEALIKERLAICYASRQGVVTTQAKGTRHRKSAVWCVLGAEAWIQQAKYIQAQRCLNQATRTYDSLSSNNGISKFSHAHEVMQGLQRFLENKLDGNAEYSDDMADKSASQQVDEESEALDDGAYTRRPSTVGRIGIPAANLETAPLHRGGDNVGDGQENTLVMDENKFQSQAEN